MARDHSNGLMAENILDSGYKVSNTEKEHTLMQKDKSKGVLGQTVRD